ncbi:MAG: prepilin peptidase [Acidobacteria bacterium]|nr:prepilin peptidase [Acidobacteriota bacterium]
MIAAITFLFGIVIGSFLNVCIHRLPRWESVVAPRSHCPHCQKPIAAYDNIPLLSFLLLGGKCRHCRARISPVYFFVELSTGLVFLFSYSLFGTSVEFLRQAVFGSLLIVLVMTDWQERILPDLINFPGMAMGLLFSLMVPVGDGSGLWLARLVGIEGLPIQMISLFDGLLGALAGWGFLQLTRQLWAVLTKRRIDQVMGMGDLKMMAMVGCFLGPKLTLLTIFVGSFLGALLGGALSIVLVARPSYFRRFRSRLREIQSYRLFFALVRRQKIPFGCFLGVGAFAASLWGWPILNWYRSFFP